MSKVTIKPSSPTVSVPHQRSASVHLKLTEKVSDSSSDHSSSSTSLPSVNLRKGSFDRVAQENRGFVITGISQNFDTNGNHMTKSSNSVDNASNAASFKMNGSYFVAATDFTGRAKALYFEKGSVTGNSLSVLEDSRGRSNSLPVTELQGLEEKCGGKQDRNLMFKDRDLSNGIGRVDFRSNPVASSIIPPFMLSSPRTSSDGLSTSYLSTNSDSGARQPVATEPKYDKRLTGDSASYLAWLGAVHPNTDQQVGLKSSTVGGTLLESLPDQQAGQYNSNGDRSVSPASSSPVLYGSGDAPQPAKIPRQSDNTNEPLAFLSQMAVFPNKPSYEEVVFAASQGQLGTVDTAKLQQISYLMATAQGGGKSIRGQKVWPSSAQGIQKPGKPLPTALSSGLQPMMVHVSSGMELCEDRGGTEERFLQTQQEDSEVRKYLRMPYAHILSWTHVLILKKYAR